jgi:hypothetical protein
MALAQRRIEVAIRLAPSSGTNQPGTFAESGTDTVNIKGLRTSVRIANSGAPAGSHATLRIYGMKPSLMNQLTTLGLVFNLVPKNTLTISAGSDPAAMSTVFSGTVYAAYGDYSALPDVPFQFDCLAGVADAVAPAPVSSFTGATSAVNVMQGLARQMGLGFENNGVDVQLSSPYFSGSLMTQAQKCAEHAGIEWGIFNGNTLAIWKRGGNRNTPDVPVISPSHGMIGYPAFTQGGIIVSTVFDPKISFGSLVKVQSSLLEDIAAAQQKPATLGGQQVAANAGIFPTTWAVNKLDLALDAQVPRGEWRSTVYAYNPNFVTPIPPNTGTGGGGG